MNEENRIAYTKVMATHWLLILEQRRLGVPVNDLQVDRYQENLIGSLDRLDEGQKANVFVAEQRHLDEQLAELRKKP